MSYSTRNGKLEKTMPPDKSVDITLRFHAVATMEVRCEKLADGSMKVVDARLHASKITTRPEDKASDQQLADIMANADALTELTGVMLVEQINRKRNPKVQLATPKAG